MATLNFPDAPDTGDIYSDSNSGFSYEWNGTVWISKDPSTASNIRELDNISGSFNGSTTQFNLTVASVAVEPANVQQLIISVGGVMQNAGDDYTVSGSTITFTTAPSSGLTFFGTLLGTALSLNTVADGSVSPTSLTTTSNYIVGGINVAGVVTGGEFSGDGSGLTGVASTDNIITSYGATFLSNVRVAGIFTAANAYVTGILTAQTLNYNNVTDIYSTGIITATGGIQQTGNEGFNNAAGVGTVSNVQHTIDASGLGATVGAAVGVVTYYGDGSNLTGAGSSFQVLSFDPYQGQEVASSDLGKNIVMGFNNGISAGNADKNITLRKTSASGTVVQTFDVDSDVTYSAGQAILNPSADLELENTYFVVADEGAIHKIGTASSSPVINTYSFTTSDAFRKLWTWGINSGGGSGLNLGPGNQKSSPTQIGTGEDWGTRGAVDAQSHDFQANIKKNGTLWIWGTNNEGQLGLNDKTQYSSPVQIPGTTWADIQCGVENVLATKTDGTLWGWGNGVNGAWWAHSGPQAARSSPIQLGTDTTWDQHQICATDDGYTALKTDGTLWAWGQNTAGCLGLNQGPSPANIFSSPVQIPGTTWDSINRGGGQSKGVMATKTDGTAWTWGQHTYGTMGQNNLTQYSSPTQLGTETTWAIAGMWQHNEKGWALATKTDGTLWSWGNADGKSLGLGNTTKRSSPTQIGTLTTWGTDKEKQYQISCGGLSGAAIRTDGTLWMWGTRDIGQLGQNEGAGPNIMDPTQVGAETDWHAIRLGGSSPSTAGVMVQGVTYNSSPGG